MRIKAPIAKRTIFFFCFSFLFFFKLFFLMGIYKVSEFLLLTGPKAKPTKINTFRFEYKKLWESQNAALRTSHRLLMCQVVFQWKKFFGDKKFNWRKKMMKFFLMKKFLVRKIFLEKSFLEKKVFFWWNKFFGKKKVLAEKSFVVRKLFWGK